MIDAAPGTTWIARPVRLTLHIYYTPQPVPVRPQAFPRRGIALRAVDRAGRPHGARRRGRGRSGPAVALGVLDGLQGAGEQNARPRPQSGPHRVNNLYHLTMSPPVLP